MFISFKPVVSNCTARALPCIMSMYGYNPYDTATLWARAAASHANIKTLQRETRNDRQASILMARQAQ